jgi:hypothetical protein
MDDNELFAEAKRAWQVHDRATTQARLMALLRANPRHVDGWLMLAGTLEEPAKVADCLTRALALSPDNAEAREWLERVQADLSGPATPVPRLGQFLLDYKFITAEQLLAALHAQRQAVAAGQARQLGDILLEHGALSPERLQFAVREQKRVQDSLEAG